MSARPTGRQHRRVLPSLLRAVATVACGALVAVAPVRAAGQDYPARLLTFVVPFTAGAVPDVFVRAVANEITRTTGIPAIVENKPGAGSMLAARTVAKAEPDGYTVLVTGNVAFTGNPHTFRKLPYDPVADFTPVTTLAKGPMYLYVNPRKLPVADTGQLLQTLRAHPGKFNFAYTSITSRLPAELLQQSMGVRILGVPYRSGASALPDLVSGQVDMLFTDLSALPYVKSGQLKVIATTDLRRSPLTPDLPTFEEAGIKGMDIGFWLGAYLPAHAPPAVVTRLQQLLAGATKAAEVRRVYQTWGTFEFLLSPAELAKFQARQSTDWGRIIRAAGIQPE
ncbi:Bug family tripartite tricarboxylate transporter substrate binding protein [Cupriavidus pinatubonensis]|uniref:Twin-arginine translocation pathway signal n=1 Tax=Cupriavidus pinatubonensis TaxID=248026 RepID=A0ABM8WFN3_9BURK|nr:tripartite tricarboxylate transporter substrate binding protein [Cupriavidus pinatubonensis]CAG9165907.1 hypothetical protein LMG23994_00851 [Cupriavidus pinatubonensis]